MSKIIRVLGHSFRKETPVEALRLSEDLAGIDLAIKLLESIDPVNITGSLTQEQRDFGRDMKRSTITLIQTWKYYATLTMRRKYLR